MKTINNMKMPVIVFSLIAAAASSVGVWADTTLNFRGSIEIVECSINNKKDMSVNFGDTVGIRKIDGKNYLQLVPFTVSCKSHSGGNIPAMTLTVEGVATTFDNSAVKTNVSGLGIQLQVNGKAQKINKPMNFVMSNIPVITAVPVKDDKVDLEARPFTATVKLRVDVA